MMKKQAYTMIAMFVLVGSMAVAARAQTSGCNPLVANIPFEFSAGNHTLPAGKYEVACMNPKSDQSVLQIRNMDDHKSTLLLMQSATRKSQDVSKLVFNRYGNRYFFAQEWVEGETTGMQAPKSRTERAAELELGAIKMVTGSVAVTARR